MSAFGRHLSSATTRTAGTLRRRWRRAPVLLGLVVALLLGLVGGAAWAFFTSTGTGSGTATVGSIQPVTLLAATGTPSSALQPGAHADLTLTVKNPNSYPVSITGLTQNGAPTVSGGTGCTAGNAGVTVPHQTGLNVGVTPGTAVVVHIPNGAAMSTTSASGCQGASFHFPVTITVRKQ